MQDYIIESIVVVKLDFSRYTQHKPAFKGQIPRFYNVHKVMFK